jgi:hypothetical protein
LAVNIAEILENPEPTELVCVIINILGAMQRAKPLKHVFELFQELGSPKKKKGGSEIFRAQLAHTGFLGQLSLQQ